jgi:hypothetical protein
METPKYTVKDFFYQEGGYDSILKAMDDNRIFSVNLNGEGDFEVIEKCDGFFGVTIPPHYLRALGEELIEMADSAQPKPTNK